MVTPEALNSLSFVFSQFNPEQKLGRLNLSNSLASDEDEAALFDSLLGVSSLMEICCFDFTLGRRGCTALANLLKHPASNIFLLTMDLTEIDVVGAMILTGE
jgi:hypothetical protein